MQLGAQLVDYTVLIGSGRCVGKDLTDNALRCQPPYNEPPVDINSNNWCGEQKSKPVTVSIRNIANDLLLLRHYESHFEDIHACKA